MHRDNSRFFVVSVLPALTITLMVKALSLESATPTFAGILVIFILSLALPILQAAYFRYRERRADETAVRISIRAAHLLGEKDFDLSQSKREMINALEKVATTQTSALDS
jgi:Zn-dependent protease with chaperone function